MRQPSRPGRPSLLSACAVSVAVLLGGTWLSPVSADSLDDDVFESSPAGSARDAQLELGRRVFHRKCAKCHVSGRENAPRIGQPGAWAQRLRQPIEVLIDHAINGHQGSRGRMPPKGDFPALTEAEVTAAVHYIVQRGEWLSHRFERDQAACTGTSGAGDCVPTVSSDGILLQLLWLLREAR